MAEFPSSKCLGQSPTRLRAESVEPKVPFTCSRFDVKKRRQAWGYMMRLIGALLLSVLCSLPAKSDTTTGFDNVNDRDIFNYVLGPVGIDSLNFTLEPQFTPNHTVAMTSVLAVLGTGAAC